MKELFNMTRDEMIAEVNRLREKISELQDLVKEQEIAIIDLKELADYDTA